MSLCIVSHDSGGAHVLASYVARNRLNCSFVLEGPAYAIFERRIGPFERSSIEEALHCCDEVLCGTSWKSDLEWQAIGAARAIGKRVFAFLDHWVNYRQRFVRGQTINLPDEIWVGDNFAKKMAQKIFSDTPIRLVPNPYFQDIEEELVAIEGIKPARNAGKGLKILFVCEPISEHGLNAYGDPRYWGYTEFEALEHFFTHIDVIGKNIDRIVIRPHPAEDEGKYNDVLSKYGEFAEIGGKRTLAEEITQSDVVVGCESMALVVGLLAKRRVISVIPPQGQKCCLPYSQIESLNSIIDKKTKS